MSERDSEPKDNVEVNVNVEEKPPTPNPQTINEPVNPQSPPPNPPYNPLPGAASESNEESDYDATKRRTEVGDSEEEEPPKPTRGR